MASEPEKKKSYSNGRGAGILREKTPALLLYNLSFLSLRIQDVLLRYPEDGIGSLI